MPGNEQGRPTKAAVSTSIASPATAAQPTTATSELRDEALARRDEGMATALEAVQPAWRAEAEEVLDRLIAGGGDFTSDEIRAAVVEPFATGSALALGGLINGRSRRGEIVQVGWTISRQPQRHGAPARIWRRAVVC